MRILFVDHSSKMGGGQLGLARYLAASSSHERELLMFEGGSLAELAQRNGIETSIVGSGDSWRSKLSRVPMVRRHIAQARPDIVIANSLTAANVLGLARVRHVPQLAYLREDLSRLSIAGIKRPMMLLGTLRNFDGFLANSRYTASTIPRMLAHKPVEVAYPISGISRGAANPPPIGDHTKIRVLSLSRLAPWKGIDVLLHAARLLGERGLGSRFEFVIAGDSIHSDPSYAQQLRRLGEAAESTVRFVGHVDDVIPLLDQSDVLALCSVRPEPFGQVIVQAMSRGRLVIATAGGGPGELLQADNCGVLVPSADPETLADALERCARDSRTMYEHGQRAQFASAAFADESTIAGLDDAISKIARTLR